jgi:AraC-like DNA-binding protein
MDQPSRPFHACAAKPPLSALIDCLWSYEGYAASHAQERLLPRGTMELIFTIGADGRVHSGLVGAHSEFLVLDTSRPFSVIGVHFRPGGGFPFFGLPAGELHNRSVTLDLVWGRYAAILRDQLWEAQTVDERFRLLERTLLQKGADRLDGHPAVRYAIREFDRSNGSRPVNDVVQQIGMSSRRFVELFRRQVGLSPKVFCRIRRFNHALRQIEQSPAVDWAEIALSCGYFDQAHFNHDFHAFSGVTPSAYLRHRVSRMHVAVTD